jgi:hypothetical protein
LFDALSTTQAAFLRNVIFHNELRAAGRAGVPAVEVEIVGEGVVVVIQFEAQADLGQVADLPSKPETSHSASNHFSARCRRFHFDKLSEFL